MRSVAVVVAWMLAANGTVAAPLCPSGDRPVAPCFTAHGRMQAWNGNPTFRIWRIGTTRVLGVHGEDAHLPPALKAAFGDNAFGKRVTADFKVCPLTRQRKGWMQMVCIVDARNVTVQSA
jgi:hypothetical protein